MNRILFVLLTALILGLALQPARAQEATPEATAVAPTTIINYNEPVTTADSEPLFDLSKAAPYLAVIVLLVALVLIEVVDKRRLAELAAKSLTPEAYAILSAGIVRGLADAGAYVKATPTPLDDALFEPADVQIRDLLDRVKALEDAKQAPPSGSNSG